jgi:ribosomal protein S18 acetylase RimI-like enzyme
MTDVLAIRRMSPDDIEVIAKLLERLARVHITHEFSPKAQQTFLKKNNADSIRQFVANGFRYHVAGLGGEIVGFVGIRDNKHLYHLFVEEQFQRQGIGRALWDVARAECLASGNPGAFTVNSSNNAVPIYERLGFVRTGPTEERDGVRYNPMALTNAG